MSNDEIGILPLKIIVPITEWNDKFDTVPWHIPINPNVTNGLTKKSSADTFQVRSISQNRFLSKIGLVSQQELEDIKQGLLISLDIL